MPKNVTLDELAAMVARGFEHIQKDMAARFDEMQKDTNERFDRIEVTLEKIVRDQKNHEVRIKQLENARA